MTGTRRRWPPHDRPLPREDDHPAYFEPMARAIGDLSKALEHLAPSVVLGEGTYQLDGLGQAAEQYRAPFAALAITSGSVKQLIIAAGTKGAGAPGPGPGSAIVRPGGHLNTNMKGYAWTLYGGNPGDLVTVQAFAKPLPPAGTSASPQAASTQATVNASGTAVTPAAGTAIATLPVVPAGLYTIRVATGFGGTAESTNANNFGLRLGATVLYTGIFAPLTINSFSNPAVVLNNVASDGVNQFILENVLAGSSGSFYQGALQADRMPGQ